MRDRESTSRSRELGEGLRQAIEQAELNAQQAARRGDPRAVPGYGPGACPAVRLCQDQHTPVGCSYTAPGADGSDPTAVGR